MSDHNDEFIIDPDRIEIEDLDLNLYPHELSMKLAPIHVWVNAPLRLVKEIISQLPVSPDLDKNKNLDLYDQELMAFQDQAKAFCVRITELWNKGKVKSVQWSQDETISIYEYDTELFWWTVMETLEMIISWNQKELLRGK